MLRIVPVGRRVDRIDQADAVPACVMRSVTCIGVCRGRVEDLGASAGEIRQASTVAVDPVIVLPKAFTVPIIVGVLPVKLMTPVLDVLPLTLKMRLIDVDRPRDGDSGRSATIEVGDVLPAGLDSTSLRGRRRRWWSVDQLEVVPVSHVPVPPMPAVARWCPSRESPPGPTSPSQKPPTTPRPTERCAGDSSSEFSSGPRTEPAR